MVRCGVYLFVCFTAMQVAAGADVTHPEEMSARWWFAEEAGAIAWAEDASPLGAEIPPLALPFEGAGYKADATVEPSQFLSPMLPSPASRQPVRTQRNPRPALRAAAAGGLASVPYMIGDTGAGTCLGFAGVLDVGLAHPTLACSRLNVAEANTALPTDRIYYSYRHFEDATPVSVYQFEQQLDVDRHTLAFERTYWDGMCSVEVRLPIEYRLSSQFSSIVAPAFGVIDLVAADNERRTELGNVSLIFKSLLFERESLAISAGLGVTLPTAEDVDYSLAVSGTVDYADGISADTNTTFATVFANETIYLLPFMAWAYAPASQWFHQGFLQVEVAANPSRVTAFGSGEFEFFDNGAPAGLYGFYTGPPSLFFQPTPVRADLFSQTLLRANLGWGYNVWESGNGGGSVDRLAGLFEVHYTSTLQDANLTEILIQQGGTTPSTELQDIQIGNVNNRVDILNLATGASLLLGNTMFTAGVVAPVRDCPDCGFDVEYNAQVQRRF